jgi:hypothetical protein
MFRLYREMVFILDRKTASDGDGRALPS